MKNGAGFFSPETVEIAQNGLNALKTFGFGSGIPEEPMQELLRYLRDVGIGLPKLCTALPSTRTRPALAQWIATLPNQERGTLAFLVAGASETPHAEGVMDSTVAEAWEFASLVGELMSRDHLNIGVEESRFESLKRRLRTIETIASEKVERVCDLGALALRKP